VPAWKITCSTHFYEIWYLSYKLVFGRYHDNNTVHYYSTALSSKRFLVSKTAICNASASFQVYQHNKCHTTVYIGLLFARTISKIVGRVARRYSDWLRAGRSRTESRWGRDFPPVQTGPGIHPASCTMGTESFPGVKCGRGVLLTTHPLLGPR